MNKTHNWVTILSWLILILLIGTEAVLLFQVWKLGMLPDKFLAVLLGLTVLATGIAVWLLFGRVKKQNTAAKRISGFIFSAVVTAGCLFGCFAVHKLNQTISSITASNITSTVVDIYVQSDDAAETLGDCEEYRFAVADSGDVQALESALDAIGDALNAQITPQHYENVFAMITALYAGDVDAIIMEQAYAGILDESDGFGDFFSRTRLLYEHIIREEIVPTEPAVEETVPVEDITTTPFLLYISGSDSRQYLLADSGSDVNILAAVNPETKQILLVNTPRDYFVANPAGDGAMDKLSHCGLSGIENSVEAIAQLYGHEIDYYAKINFAGFETLINAIGGVTIHSDFAFTVAKYYEIRQGENHLNGAEALAYVRERQAVAGGDNARGKHQMKIISAIIDQISAGKLLTNYTQILDSLDGMFAITIPPDDLAKLVKMQLTDMATWNVHSYAVTGSGGKGKPWAQNGLYAYVMYPHEETVEFAADLIGRVLTGEILTQDDLVMATE